MKIHEICSKYDILKISLNYLLLSVYCGLHPILNILALRMDLISDGFVIVFNFCTLRRKRLKCNSEFISMINKESENSRSVFLFLSAHHQLNFQTSLHEESSV